MIEAFGDRLVRVPLERRGKIEALPSPEVLKGRILVKVTPVPLSTNQMNLLITMDVARRQRIQISCLTPSAATRDLPVFVISILIPLRLFVLPYSPNPTWSTNKNCTKNSKQVLSG